MKFICFVDINAPRDQVVQLFSDPSKLIDWQDGFKRIEHVSGTPSTKDAISNIYYKFGRGEMLIQETIIENNLPDNFIGLYQHKHMTNTMNSVFTILNDENTSFSAEVEYTKISGFIAKLMVFFMPSMSKRQVQKWMDQFKDLVESSF